MKLRFTRKAFADLLEVSSYLTEQSPAGSANVEVAIRKAVGLLEALPEMGRREPKLNARVVPVPNYPYSIYYRIKNEEIEVVHIRHQRRKPATKKDLS